MAVFRGTKRGDIRKGSNAADTILGFDGADTLSGRGGNDTIKGGRGNDRLFGGLGHDKLFGEWGSDRLKGEAGNDTLAGGAGNDVIVGGAGVDTAVFSTSWAKATIAVAGATVHVRGGASDGTDAVSQVERFKFANGTFTAAQIVNDAPVAGDDVGLSIDEDAALVLTPAQLLSNDTDADKPLGDKLSIASVHSPLNGTVALVDGQIVFTPAADFNGVASFSYSIRDLKGAVSTATVSVDIVAVNDPATITGDLEGAVTEDSVPISGNLDLIDVDNAVDTFQPVDVPAISNGGYGAYTLATDGVWTYALDNEHEAVTALTAGDELTDTFTALAADGTAQMVIITIHGANDVPIISSDGGGAAAQVTLDENEVYVTTVVASDADASQSLSYAILGGADAGLFAIDPDLGELTFITAPDYELPADADGDNLYEVEVGVSDGSGGTDAQSLAVVIAGVNEAPTALDDDLSDEPATSEDSALVVNAATLLANDWDPDGDSLVIGAADPSSSFGASVSLVGGDIVYDPSDSAAIQQLVAGQSLIDTITYAVNDGHGGMSSAFVFLKISGVDDAPVIVSDGGLSAAAIGLEENVMAVTTVLAIDADGTMPGYSIVGGADESLFAITPAGDLSFIVAPDFELPLDADVDNTYEVVVRASDGSLFADQAISVTVQDVADYLL